MLSDEEIEHRNSQAVAEESSSEFLIPEHITEKQTGTV